VAHASEMEASNSHMAVVVAVVATTVVVEVATATTVNNSSNKWEVVADIVKTPVEEEEGHAVVD
jgi:hypothetical protein